MNVRIDIAQLRLAGLDERAARRVLAYLRSELAACAVDASWHTASVPLVRASVRDDDPRRIARALAQALVRSVT